MNTILISLLLLIMSHIGGKIPHKGKRKLIELILVITVAWFPSGLFQRSYYIFNQKNKPEVGLHHLWPFYVIIFSQTTQNLCKPSQPVLEWLLDFWFVSTKSSFLLLNYNIYLAREEKIRLPGIALKVHQHRDAGIRLTASIKEHVSFTELSLPTLPSLMWECICASLFFC